MKWSRRRNRRENSPRPQPADHSNCTHREALECRGFSHVSIGAGILTPMSRTLATALAAIAAIATLTAACGGGSGKTTTRTVAATAPGAAPTRVVVTRDGAVDQVITAALAADEIELAGLVGYQKITCKKNSGQQPGDPPICRESESDGTVVEVFASSGCTATWTRPEQVPDVFRVGLPKGAPQLLAVFHPKAAASPFGVDFEADRVAVFRVGTHGDSQASGAALHIRNGRIVWFEADCRNLLELIAPERVDAFILDPSGTVTPPTATP